MSDYLTDAEAASFTGGATNNPKLQNAAAAACRSIDSWCGRVFSAGEDDEERTYTPLDGCTVWIDDCYSITSIKSDDADSGTFGTTWATTDYETDPHNGIGPNGRSGWPVSKIRAVGTKTFYGGARSTVKVTGKFGWAAVPDEVKQAAKLIANRYFALANTPLGMIESGEFSNMPVREGNEVRRILAPYVRYNSSSGKYLVG